MQCMTVHRGLFFFFLSRRENRTEKNLMKCPSLLEICDPSGKELLSLSFVHNCGCFDKMAKQVTSMCRKMYKFKVLNLFVFYFKTLIYLFLTAHLAVPSGFSLHWSNHECQVLMGTVRILLHSPQSMWVFLI